jgi:molybdenum cofactor cytidylyltransferase
LNIAVLILAAGESKRFGKTKQLLSIGTQTVLQKTTGNYTGSNAGQVIVILGHQSEQIAASIRNMPVTVVINQNYKQGMGTSIAAGLAAIKPGIEGIMLALADQPLVDTATINFLIDAFKSGGKGIVIPAYKSKRGNPVIFDIKYKAQLMLLKGDVGGREIIKNNPGDVLEISVNSKGVLLDIDTEESYNRIKNGQV